MRLIDANELQDRLRKAAVNALKENDLHYFGAFYVFYMLVQNECHEVDAEPVRHGHWNWDDGYVGTQAVCSICGKSPLGFYALPKNQIGRLPEYPYCPRCGAKMDGV